MSQSSKTRYHLWKDAVTASDLPPISKLACLILQGYTTPSDTELHAWPSVATLAQKMSCTSDTVRKAVRKAEQQGFIKRKERFTYETSRRGNLSNLYELTLPDRKAVALPSITSLVTPFEGRGIPNLCEDLTEKIRGPDLASKGDVPEENRTKYTTKYKSEYTTDTRTEYASESTQDTLELGQVSISKKLLNWGYPQAVIDELKVSGELDLVFQLAKEIDQQDLGRRSKQKAHNDYIQELLEIYGL